MDTSANESNYHRHSRHSARRCYPSHIPRTATAPELFSADDDCQWQAGARSAHPRTASHTSTCRHSQLELKLTLSESSKDSIDCSNRSWVPHSRHFHQTDKISLRCRKLRVLGGVQFRNPIKAILVSGFNFRSRRVLHFLCPFTCIILFPLVCSSCSFPSDTSPTLSTYIFLSAVRLTCGNPIVNLITRPSRWLCALGLYISRTPKPCIFVLNIRSLLLEMIRILILTGQWYGLSMSRVRARS